LSLRKMVDIHRKADRLTAMNATEERINKEVLRSVAKVERVFVSMTDEIAEDHIEGVSVLRHPSVHPGQFFLQKATV
jgi:predicted transcriptional regulator